MTHDPNDSETLTKTTKETYQMGPNEDGGEDEDDEDDVGGGFGCGVGAVFG